MMKLKSCTTAFVFISIAILLIGCAETKEKNTTLTVTATAYNSVESQTKKGNVGLAAWGDTLVPGEKAIAVSRDLIKKGLSHNEEVKIDGLEGTYIVKDKMNKRWESKIDIYMGLDEEAALEWGKKKVEIQYYKEESLKD
jgi:3D (Asp-Asp-Asp) domain-containing protein